MNVSSAANKRGSIIACASILAVAALLVPLFAQKDADHDGKTTKDATAGNYAYSAKYVNQVLPGGPGDSIKEVYKFPAFAPVFLVRTSKAITVWERKDKALATLLDIRLDGDFENLLFLEDGKTFVIHTSRSASVYVLNRDLVIPKGNTSKDHTQKTSK